MKNTRARELFFAAVGLAVLLAAPPPAPAESAPKTIRWVAAHTRSDDAYTPLLRAFAARLEKSSNGSLKVEFVGESLPERGSDPAAHKLLLDGGADMGQYEQELTAFVPAVTAPFAFRSYGHAEAVFNGPVGKRLLDRLYAASDRKLRALAFTYSGGQRVFFGAKALRSVADLSGQRMESPGNSGWSHLMDELMTSAGAKLVPVSEDAAAFDQFEGVINRGPRQFEKTAGLAKRFKYANLTHHGLLVTAVVAREGFLKGLSPEQRRVLGEEVDALALEERKLSIALEPERLAALKKLGVKPVTLPAPERAKLMELGEAVLMKHADVMRDVEEIRSVKEERLTTKL